MTHQPPSIVVLDDDTDFLDLNARMLQRAGYRVRTFSTSAQAMSAILQDPPDLIITDLMMENLDSGFTFSQAVKDDPRLKSVPVIVITAMTSQRGYDFRPRTQDDLAAMNAEAFFEKPVDYDKLIAKVHEILNKRPGELT
ncbi:MAG: response regulator [Candidatus Hydrogenedentes bacterium]|nr:response regulator [Candidatus Hydrogenedentota bacterium]